MDESLVLDVNALHLSENAPGAWGTVTWRQDGEPVDSAQLRIERDQIHVGDQAVGIAWVPCHFGGERPFFICEGCGQKAVKLYVLPDGDQKFVCRRCGRLVYASQNEGPGDRAVRKAEKALDRLGPDDGSARHRLAQLRAMRPLFEEILAALGPAQGQR